MNRHEALSSGYMELSPAASSSSDPRVMPGLQESHIIEGRVAPSLKYGPQAYFWTQDWQQAERLAHHDFLIGDVYEPSDVEDGIAWLHDDEDEE